MLSAIHPSHSSARVQRWGALAPGTDNEYATAYQRTGVSYREDGRESPSVTSGREPGGSTSERRDRTADRNRRTQGQGLTMAANNRPVAGGDPAAEPTIDEEAEDEDSAAGTESQADSEELPLDQVFEILKNKRRRTVLRYLDEHEEPVALGDLAEHVAADENDTPVAQISSRERKCAYVGLYQCHLPKMDDMDIIAFNQNRGLVETGPNATQLKQYLEWSETSTRPWPLYYASTAGVGLVAVLATGVLAGGAAAMVVCLAAMLAVAGTAAVHLQSERQDTESAGE